MQVATTTIAGLVTVIAVAFVVRAVWRILAVIRLGQPDPERFDRKLLRLRTMLAETLGHTRMLRWTLVGVAHWVVMVAFVTLTTLVVEAYFEVVSPTAELPVIGHWSVFGLASELVGLLGLLGITVLIVIRLLNLPTRRRWSRFAGSTSWQAYYVEYTILAVLACGFLVRAGKAAGGYLPFPVWAAPVSHAIGALLPLDGHTTGTTTGTGLSAGTAVSVVALLKILVSMAWLITIALNVTMGVAWHRFTAFFNIFFKRDPGSAASGLGALRPMMSRGRPLDFEQADPESDQFGVAAVEQFTWKGLLDFATCTECGRCQSQCPAWNTGKPLSPKLLVLSLRDHAYAKAPDERPIVGDARSLGVVAPEVLWSCTTCGACVEQCPVDIEHVDHIMDLRRHQVLIESEFPREAGVMLRNLENRGNPWGAPPATREDWTRGLDFSVPLVSEGAEFEYLFWVGCAGAFDDRARKTTRAVATLLHEAGVSFAVLGNQETCTGDPARRIGNEFLFQVLARQNVKTLAEAGVRKIVASCPHCFNTLANEYGQLGGSFEVLHHTQLLARLVRDGKLVPARQTDAAVTYHDPCYLGRHNRVFTPPRELLDVSTAHGSVEMPRSVERSFCCGAGGARMWMEEQSGRRVSTDRVQEALATGASTIAVGCPFCLTMLSDGVGSVAPGQAEVVDVATILLNSIHQEGSHSPAHLDVNADASQSPVPG